MCALRRRMNETEQKKRKKRKKRTEAHRSEESFSSRHFGLQRMINFDIFSSSSYVIFFALVFLFFFLLPRVEENKKKSSPADSVSKCFLDRQIRKPHMNTRHGIYEVNFIIFSWPCWSIGRTGWLRHEFSQRK